MYECLLYVIIARRTSRRRRVYRSSCATRQNRHIAHHIDDATAPHGGVCLKRSRACYHMHVLSTTACGAGDARTHSRGSCKHTRFFLTCIFVPPDSLRIMLSRRDCTKGRVRGAHTAVSDARKRARDALKVLSAPDGRVKAPPLRRRRRRPQGDASEGDAIHILTLVFIMLPKPKFETRALIRVIGEITAQTSFS